MSFLAKSQAKARAERERLKSKGYSHALEEMRDTSNKKKVQPQSTSRSHKETCSNCGMYGSKCYCGS